MMRQSRDHSGSRQTMGSTLSGSKGVVGPWDQNKEASLKRNQLLSKSIDFHSKERKSVEKSAQKRTPIIMQSIDTQKERPITA